MALSTLIFRGTTKILKNTCKYNLIGSLPIRSAAVTSCLKLQSPRLSVITPKPTSICLEHVKAFASNTEPIIEEGEEKSNIRLWTFQRLLAAGMLGLLPATIYFQNYVLDCIAVTCLVMHNHWGIENVVKDYVQPHTFGNLIPKIAHLFAYVLSIATLVGLLYLIFNDCGFSKAIALIWKLE